MHKQLKSLYFAVALLLVLPVLSGCVAFAIGAAAGAGGYGYVKGSLQKNYDYSVVDLHKAALKAIKSLGIEKTDEELNRHSSYIKGVYEDGKKLKIVITALTERSAKIDIRIGILGDESASQMIMSGIEKNL